MFGMAASNLGANISAVHKDIKAGREAKKIARANAERLNGIGGNVGNENYSSFRDLMSSEEAARYDAYWYDVGTQKAVDARDTVLSEINTWSNTKKEILLL